MTRIWSCFLTTIILISLAQLCIAQAPMKWKIHDLNRPVARRCRSRNREHARHSGTPSI